MVFKAGLSEFQAVRPRQTSNHIDKKGARNVSWSRSCALFKRFALQLCQPHGFAKAASGPSLALEAALARLQTAMKTAGLDTFMYFLF